MHKLFLSSLLITLLSCSSGNKKTEIPDNVLTQDKIVNILVDIHIEEAKLNVLPERHRSAAGAAADTIDFTEVFKKNKVKKAQFDSSMLFYTQHPVLMNETYDKVIEIITADKTKAEKKLPAK